jgi:uncharacterized protein YbjT (DUF2867 family)
LLSRWRQPVGGGEIADRAFAAGLNGTSENRHCASLAVSVLAGAQKLMTQSLSVVMLGASGAVGGQVVNTLLAMPEITRLTLLGRREIALPVSAKASIVQQHVIDIDATDAWKSLVEAHDCAICTLGVGQPSKMSKAEFVHIDRDVVIAFATICRQAGVRHFELLGSAGADSRSKSFYLRTKGELRDALVALDFERLSVFQPSMILTPTNRYGLSQALTLALWPSLSKLMIGPMRKFRGIRVETLGAAMARNLLTTGRGAETLHRDEFMQLTSAPR